MQNNPILFPEQLARTLLRSATNTGTAGPTLQGTKAVPPRPARSYECLGEANYREQEEARGVIQGWKQKPKSTFLESLTQRGKARKQVFGTETQTPDWDSSMASTELSQLCHL